MPTLIDEEMFPQDTPAVDRPKTISVLVVLLVTAVVLSYLVGYALPQVLVLNNVMAPWPEYDDPRRRWMALSLFTVLTSYMVLWGFFRLLGAMQFRRIDAMTQD
jgi:hypothetical protein